MLVICEGKQVFLENFTSAVDVKNDPFDLFTPNVLIVF